MIDRREDEAVKRVEVRKNNLEKELRVDEQCGSIGGKSGRTVSTDSRLRTHVERLLLLSHLAGAPSLKIGHLPDEIEDLHGWFNGYYRRRVWMVWEEQKRAERTVDLPEKIFSPLRVKKNGVNLVGGKRREESDARFHTVFRKFR
ncbi:hypothetical protein KM043_013258 [Ampulex compressa]|nr:hypothetical protein KM043_013258 [Ampulex compressa]